MFLFVFHEMCLFTTMPCLIISIIFVKGVTFVHESIKDVDEHHKKVWNVQKILIWIFKMFCFLCSEINQAFFIDSSSDWLGREGLIFSFFPRISYILTIFLHFWPCKLPIILFFSLVWFWAPIVRFHID